MVDWAHPVKATHNATKAAIHLFITAGLQHGRLFLVHLVLGLLFLGLDGLEHLLGLLGGDSGLALRLRLLVLVLLVLILILVLVLILVLILVLVLILLVLVLVLILVLVVIPATAAVRIVLQHLPGIDIVYCFCCRAASPMLKYVSKPCALCFFRDRVSGMCRNACW